MKLIPYLIGIIISIITLIWWLKGNYNPLKEYSWKEIILKLKEEYNNDNTFIIKLSCILLSIALLSIGWFKLFNLS